MSTRKPLSPVLTEGRVVAIVRGGTGEHLLDVCSTLVDSGVRCLEITTGTPGWAQGVLALRRRYGADVELGTGTVLTADHVAATAQAGGAFVVSPAVDPEVGRAAAEHDLAWFPGALTPTEIVTAWRAGATAVKVFPVAAVGGPEYVRQVRAPLTDVPLVPTGGVGLENAREHLRAGAVAVGVGSPLVGDALETGDLRSLASRATALLRALEEHGA